MEGKSFKSMTLKAILLIISIFYVSFLYMDFFSIRSYISTDIIKFISILLCFLIGLLTGKDAINIRDKHLLQVGLFFTIMADLCLLILDYFVLGIVLFCIVQITYFVRYKVNQSGKSSVVRFLILFEALIVLYIVANFFFVRIPFLFVIALFYSICLGSSVVKALKACKNNTFLCHNKYMIAFGMILFLLCDINVGIYNMPRFSYLSGYFTEGFYNTSRQLVWFFYLPSQVLLALSGYKFYMIKK